MVGFKRFSTWYRSYLYPGHCSRMSAIIYSLQLQLIVQARLRSPCHPALYFYGTVREGHPTRGMYSAVCQGVCSFILFGEWLSFVFLLFIYFFNYLLLIYVMLLRCYFICIFFLGLEVACIVICVYRYRSQK